MDSTSSISSIVIAVAITGAVAVAVAKRLDRAGQLLAVTARTTCCLTENLFRSGGAKLLHLSVNALAVYRNARIAENRHAGRVAKRLSFASNFCIAGTPEKHGVGGLCKSLICCCGHSLDDFLVYQPLQFHSTYHL